MRHKRRAGGRLDVYYLLLMFETGSLRQQSFKMKKEHYFNGHRMGQFTVNNRIQCLTKCLARYSCLSVNIRTIGSGADNCVLNNATLWEDSDMMITNVTDSIDPRDWVYYEVEYPAFRL